MSEDGTEPSIEGSKGAGGEQLTSCGWANRTKRGTYIRCTDPTCLVTFSLNSDVIEGNTKMHTGNQRLMRHGSDSEHRQRGDAHGSRNDSQRRSPPTTQGGCHSASGPSLLALVCARSGLRPVSRVMKHQRMSNLVSICASEIRYGQGRGTRRLPS